ncbi:MAG: FKBP-type peptidyl-prolyl cis-trans isomerase [Promethearchaeota archaeon]
MTNGAQKGNLVSVKYEGTLDDGTLFDSSDMHGGEPLKFIIGENQIIDGFEKAVIGKNVGDEFTVKIPPEEAYGKYDSTLIQKVPKERFHNIDQAKPGMLVQFRQAHGDHSHDLVAIILEIGDETVTLDFNHPLAGKSLNFKIKIVGIEKS